MLASKASLAKAIKTIDDFDLTGSPFVGLQWGENAPLFHRSGPAGYVESLGYRAAAPDLVVSISHLKAQLARFDEESVDLSVERNGVLALRGPNPALKTEMHVHTVRPNVTWAKTHDPGDRTVSLEPTGFHGINTSPFPLSSPPILRQNKLMLVTTSSCIITRSEVPVEAYPYPRESFLRTISPLSIEELYLTKNGYWGASASGFKIMIAGHRAGEQAFDTYNRSAVTIAELPASRLAYSLTQAAAIVAKKKSKVTFDAVHGLQVVDEFNNDATFSLGPSNSWPKFAIGSGMADTLADVLRQSTEEIALLQEVDSEIFRITRGLWSVSFKYFPLDATKVLAGL